MPINSGFFEKELGYDENTIIMNRRGTVIHKNFETHRTVLVSPTVIGSVENGEIVVLIVNNPRNVLCFNLGESC